MEMEKYMREKQRNNVIKKRDFERYEILLPFKALAGKRKKQFLCSELEKLHPCFSDEFAYDSSIHGIKKGGICEEVFVINKFKLAEYEGKRHFAGSGFFMEDNFFRRFFVDKKWRFTLCAILGCVTVSLAGCLSGALAAASAGTEFVVEPEKLSDDISVSVTSRLSDIKICPFEISFFEAVSAADGKITAFEWKTDGFTQKLKAGLQGVFPEIFSPEDGLSTGTVVYENGCPKMTVFYERQLSQQAALIQERTGISETSDFYKEMRTALWEFGGVLKEENTFPYHIEFICHPLSENKKVFASLASLISINNFSVTAVNVKQTGRDELSLGISVERLPFYDAGFDLNLIEQNLSLFIEAESTASVQKAVVIKESVQDEQVETSWQKLGEIKKSDKSSVVFYKNAEGKLEIVK